MNLCQASEANLKTKENRIQELQKIILSYDLLVRDIIARAPSDERYSFCENYCRYESVCDSYELGPGSVCVYRMLRATEVQDIGFISGERLEKALPCAEKLARAAIFHEDESIIKKILGEKL